MKIVMETASINKQKAIGTLYVASMKYKRKYKIGSNQKLQKILGEDLYFKKGDNWYWNNNAIIKMTTKQLNELISKLQ